MDELQLIGYTADLKYLVLCDAQKGASRFKVPVDDDLVATLTEVLQLVDPDRDDPFAQRQPVDDPALAHSPLGPGLAAVATLFAVPTDSAPPSNGEVMSELRESKLPPREIQALLRAGKTTRAVAKLAGTDEAWVRRWLAPIEAERQQVIQAAQRGRLSKARLGPSSDLLGDAVDKNLRAKGVDPEGEDAAWTAWRRDGEQTWTVTLRFRSRGRARQAVWRFDPERRDVQPLNPTAAEIAWTRARLPGATPQGPQQAVARARGTTKKQAPAAKRTTKKQAPAAKPTTKKQAPAAKPTTKKQAPAAKRTGKKQAGRGEQTRKKSARAERQTAKKPGAAKSTGPASRRRSGGEQR